jgi:spore coat protein U-like protein
MKRLMFSILLSTGALVVLSSHAETLTTNIPVSITVVSSCSSISATPINFGSVPIGSLNAGTTGSLNVTCGAGIPFSIDSDGGQNLIESRRSMVNGSSGRIRYRLYKEAGFFNSWNPGPGSEPIFGTGTGATQLIPIYAQTLIIASDPVTVGTYTDIVVATLNF